MLRLNLHKNETIINKTKYNFIKYALITDQEIQIEIKLNIKETNNERVCLFCLMNDFNNKPEICEDYDFALIKSGI